MLKTICIFIIVLITLAVFHVESRNVHGSWDGVAPSRIRLFRVGKDPFHSDSSNDDDADGYIHAKRKSEFLSSLYSLPYSLVNKRNAD